ncbi:hypothetical protein HAX54_043155 [Datura stramonium]|uniref:Cation/H+ exchanger domain-containing protein n=1 Tax=Datura stramonium TaxID=4076 RepID=A0ABS8SMR8_DATST|nr:hypothetical protein [Datura stramonium]
MGFNETNSIKTSSDGIWQGENTLHYAFPMLIIQTTLVVFLSRLLAFLLKPLRQPKVVAEILAGIMLGPSAFGRSKAFTHWIFPSWSTPILECVASIGLLFFLFLVGLELDLNTILRSGKKAVGIAFAGISLPFLFSIGVAFLLRKVIKGIDSVGYGEFFLFIGVSLSITAFPVLARILAELRLLTTQVGEMAMAAAAFNDVAAWILLALAVALAGGGSHHSPLISLWVLLSGIGFVVFMFLIVRPIMIWVAQKASSCGNNNNIIVEETCICLTLAGVMLFGFITDFIGIHAIFGSFIFGLVVPKTSGNFSERLISRIEDFVCGLLLPLYFASSGIKTDVSRIHGFGAWGLVVLVVSTACAGKVLGTFIVGIMLCAMPVRDALALGFLMNTKGLVELIVLNIGKEKKVLDDETFAILVIMALFTTFITTPIVIAIHKPSSTLEPQLEKPQRKIEKQNNLRILACLRGPRDARALINLIESLRSDKNNNNNNNNNCVSVIKLYAMRLVEFTDRLSSTTMVRRARKNGFPFIGRVLRRDDDTIDQVGAAFEAYSTLGRVKVRPTLAISGLPDLHEDIIHVAEKKRAELIILPFDKYWQMEGDEEVVIHAGHGWRMVNERVMSRARCSVAVMVDRGLQLVNNGMRVCIVFFGGADCRKALEFGSKMVEHPTIRVTLVRFIQHGSTNFDEAQRTLDDCSIAEFKMKWGKQTLYTEKEANDDLVKELLAIGRSGEFELMIVGNKVKFSQGIMARLFEQNNSELGPIANLLASSGKGIKSSVLVIHQQANFG